MNWMILIISVMLYKDKINNKCVMLLFDNEKKKFINQLQMIIKN